MLYPQIEAQDAVVIGVSPDEPKALAKFREKYNLPFILLSDPDHAGGSLWRGEKTMYRKKYEGLIPQPLRH